MKVRMFEEEEEEKDILVVVGLWDEGQKAFFSRTESSFEEHLQ